MRSTGSRKSTLDIGDGEEVQRAVLERRTRSLSNWYQSPCTLTRDGYRGETTSRRSKAKRSSPGHQHPTPVG